MKYYAKVYTGNPTIGMLTPGEYLTETQAKQYGEEKLKELCERGVLTAVPEAGDAKAQTTAKPAEPEAKKPEAEKPEPKKPEAKKAEMKPGKKAAAPEPENIEEDEELPELDADDVLGEAEKPKKRGRRKAE